MVLSMDRWVGKVAIVTGASAGIGAAIAEKLVKEGLIVVGLARRSEMIEELSKQLVGSKGKLHALKTDMANEEEILNAFKWTTENLGPVHVLVNNAGIHIRNNLWNGITSAWRQTLDVNVLGLSIATREAVRIMRENNIDGHIIHINSICGHKCIQMSLMDIYTASKHAVTALAETLRLELGAMNSKIKITSLSPGAVDTPIFSEEIRQVEAFKQALANVLKPEDIADGVAYALSTPPHVQIQELTITPVGERL